MLVPDYWAEARLQQRTSTGKQVTVRRFGWSEVSQADAEAMAQTRADEAMATILSGTSLPRSEPKVPYNGAKGTPIREEVLSRHGDSVITRNSYGAHCLNTPNLLIADVDFQKRYPASKAVSIFFVLALCSVAASFLVSHCVRFLVLALVLSIVASPFLAAVLHRLSVSMRGGHMNIARQRVLQFLRNHSGWSLRLYRTPAGLRIIATHRSFLSGDVEVSEFFRAVGVDPVYAIMCENQSCFRARLTAKPWRIGIASHMRPRPGVWPVRSDRASARNAWVAVYERAALSYAACSYIETMGIELVDDSLAPIVELHDRQSRALVSSTPIA